MRSILPIAGVVTGIALLFVPQQSIAQEPDPLVGIWLDDGRWEWEITKAGGSYKVRGLTDQHAGNRAQVNSFDGTTAVIEFWSNGYHGTIAFMPKTQKGIRIFQGLPGDSASQIGKEYANTMVLQPPKPPLRDQARTTPRPRPGEMGVESGKLTLLDANSKFTDSLSFPLPPGPPGDEVLSQLVGMKETRIGAVADGTSLLLARLQVNGPGRAAFSLIGAEKNGSLWDIESFGRKDFESAGQPTVETPTYRVDGKFYAFALYKPPAEFGRFPETKQSRAFQLKAEFKPTTEEPNLLAGVTLSPGDTGCSIELIRPPVLLVHGTYDNPIYCWQEIDKSITPKPAGLASQPLFKRLQDLGFQVMAADYRQSNGTENPSSFERNRYAVFRNIYAVSKEHGGIEDAVAACRKKGYAVTQLDLVCHSMGGVLARKFAEGRAEKRSPDDDHYHHPEKRCTNSCGFHRKDNFLRGDIHRLITLCSTHMGSDCPRFFIALQKVRAEGSIFTNWDRLMAGSLNLAAHFKQGVYTEAFEDQNPEGEALRAIGQTPMLVHAIACTSEDGDLEESYQGRLETIWKFMTPSLLEKAFGEYMDQAEEGRQLARLKERQLKLFENEDELLHMESAMLQWDAISKSSYSLLRLAVFGNTPNDCTVRLESAWGGLKPPVNATDPAQVTKIEHVLHGFAPQYESVQRRVIDLLIGTSDNFDPKGFPPAGAKPTNGPPVKLDAPATPSEKDLAQGKFVRMMVRCPVNVVIRDRATGKRLGSDDGTTIYREIPGGTFAKMPMGSENLWWFGLPQGTYDTSVTAYEAGKVRIDLLQEGAGLHRYYPVLEIAEGQRAEFHLMADGALGELKTVGPGPATILSPLNEPYSAKPLPIEGAAGSFLTSGNLRWALAAGVVVGVGGAGIVLVKRRKRSVPAASKPGPKAPRPPAGSPAAATKAPAPRMPAPKPPPSPPGRKPSPAPGPTTKSSKCPNCGTPVPPGVRFCIVCDSSF